MEKLSSFEVAPFQALMNMLKTNYLERPEIFRTVLALLCDYDCTDQNSYDMTVRYLRILLTKNSDLAECLITFMQPFCMSTKSTAHNTDTIGTADKETKQDLVHTTKRPTADPFVHNLPQTKLKQSPGSAFFRPTKMNASPSSTSTVATLYPTLRSSLVRGPSNRAAIPAQFSPFLYPAYFPMMGAPVTWMRRPHGCIPGNQMAMSNPEEALDLTQPHNPSGPCDEQPDSKEKEPAKSKTVDENVSDEKSFEKSSQKTVLPMDDQVFGESFSAVLPNNNFQPSVTTPAEYARVFYQNQPQSVGSSGIPYKIVDSSTEVYLGTARNLTSFPYLQRMILPDGQMKTIAFDSDPSHQPQINPSETLLDQSHYQPSRERAASTVAKIKPKPVCESSSSTTVTRAGNSVESKTNANKSKKRPLRTVVQIGLKEKVKKLSKSIGTSSKE